MYVYIYTFVHVGITAVSYLFLSFYKKIIDAQCFLFYISLSNYTRSERNFSDNLIFSSQRSLRQTDRYILFNFKKRGRKLKAENSTMWHFFLTF